MEPIGVGVNAQGRGGTDVAVGDTAYSQIKNPATLGLRYESEFNGGTHLFMPDIEWEGPLDSATSQKRHIFSPHVATAMPLNDKFVFGTAFYGAAGSLVDFRFRHLSMPYAHRSVAADLKIGEVQFNLAYRVTDKLSIGGGTRVAMALPKFNQVLSGVDVRIKRGRGLGFGFQLGAHYQVTDDVSIGAAYKSPTWFEDIESDADVGLLGMNPRLGKATLKGFGLPQSVAAGAAWNVTDWFMLTGDVRFVDYRHNSYGEGQFVIDSFLPIDIIYPMDLELKDLWVFSVGAEFKLSDRWTLGVGYNYGRSLISTRRFTPHAPGNVEHHATVGLRYDTGKWFAGLAYVHAFRNVIKSDSWPGLPLAIDPTNAELEHRQNSIIFTFGFRW
jgi:long-chain fatty acid transport protein